MPEPIVRDLGMYIMPPEPISKFFSISNTNITAIQIAEAKP
jgi:hypothetical protein